MFLTDWAQLIKEREETRMTPKGLAQATGRVKLHFTLPEMED